MQFPEWYAFGRIIIFDIFHVVGIWALWRMVMLLKKICVLLSIESPRRDAVRERLGIYHPQAASTTEGRRKECSRDA